MPVEEVRESLLSIIVSADGSWTVKDRLTDSDTAPSSSYTLNVMVCSPVERVDKEKEFTSLRLLSMLDVQLYAAMVPSESSP